MVVAEGTVAEGPGAGTDTAAERTETGPGQSPRPQGERESAKQALMSCHLEVSYLVWVQSQAWQLQQPQCQQQVVSAQPLQVHFPRLNTVACMQGHTFAASLQHHILPVYDVGVTLHHRFTCLEQHGCILLSAPFMYQDAVRGVQLQLQPEQAFPPHKSLQVASPPIRQSGKVGGACISS